MFTSLLLINSILMRFYKYHFKRFISTFFNSIQLMLIFFIFSRFRLEESEFYSCDNFSPNPQLTSSSSNKLHHNETLLSTTLRSFTFTFSCFTQLMSIFSYSHSFQFHRAIFLASQRPQMNWNKDNID